MRRAVAALLAAAVAATGACKGRTEPDRVETGGRSADAAARAGGADPAGPGASAGAGSGSGSGSARTAPPDEPDAQADPGKQIADLGAIPAWQAVVDRARLLARRGEKGIVYGRIGPAAAPYVWLVDDTEGNGALGIRLAPGQLQAREGDRVAASGAWELDAERRWYWKAEALQPLAQQQQQQRSPAAPADPPVAAPTHAPPAAPLPPGARPIKQARDNDIVVFQLAGPLPAGEGEGWLVAGRLFDLPVALLILPGERPSYGGHDMRSPDERWQLKRQVNYWVRIGKIRTQGAGKPFLVNARTAPFRVM